jgi:hypothetical protein
MTDNYGYFGPNYDFAGNIPLPGQIGVRTDPSVGAIIDSVAGVNTYVDIIAFGGPTFFDQQNPQPMGARYFLNTGLRCSNGATMSKYVDGVTRGDLLGASVENALASAGLPGMRGLAPGMLENAVDALDPQPIIAAVSGTGYPVCQQVQCPVGDNAGSIVNASDPSQTPYIVDPVQYVNGKPYQSRWVQAYDATGSPINITKDEFAAAPKCYNADGTYQSNPPTGCPPLELSATSTPGAAPYSLCTVTQPVQLPPTLQPPATTEGFAGSQIETMGTVVALAVLGGVALWAVSRR